MTFKSRSLLIAHLSICLFTAGLAFGAGSATEAKAEGTSTISGSVSFDGAAPAPEKIKMDADPACRQQHKEPVFSEAVVVTNGKLKNVAVYVKKGAPAGQPAAPTSPFSILNSASQWRFEQISEDHLRFTGQVDMEIGPMTRF